MWYKSIDWLIDKWNTKMVVDSIKTFILYFINSKEPQTTATTTEPVPTTTMSTAIASSDDVQSLYTIVENGFKDNVSLELRFYNEYRSHSQQCATKFIWNSSALVYGIWVVHWFGPFFTSYASQETRVPHFSLRNVFFFKKIDCWFRFYINFKVYWTLGATIIVVLVATVMIIWQRWFNKGKLMSTFSTSKWLKVQLPRW